ncbi:MAG: hypothetical protein IJ717_08085 [Treponema sp.]|nr:hypothetical protein [Treponema sp.]
MRTRFLAILLFISPFLCVAEEVFSVEDFLSDTEAENSRLNEIRQPFEWSSAGDVLMYRIEIERLDDDGSAETVFVHETDREESERCMIYIEPTLPPGKYRSTIKVYNVLGMLEERLTSRDEFFVRKAHMPVVRGVSYPLYMGRTMYLDDLDNDGILKIEGRNLLEPLLDGGDGGAGYTEYTLKSAKRTLRPVEVLAHDEEDRSITLRFDMRQLDVGEYHIFARDASGLHSTKSPDSLFTVKFKKWLDIDIEAGYTCPVVMHDDTFPTYLNKSSPVSAQARATVVPIKRRWGYLGFAVRGVYSSLYKDGGGYTIDGNLAMAHALFAYQIPMFRRRVIAEIHGGAGFTYFNNIVFHFAHGIDSEPLNTISPSFDAGAAVQLYINKRLYVEVGADYILTLNKDMTMGSFQPSMGVGWQF